MTSRTNKIRKAKKTKGAKINKSGIED